MAACMSEETWLPVCGYEGLYEVSNCGRVKSLERTVVNNGGLQLKRERVLKQNQREGGYYSVVLSRDGVTQRFLVHRLVAQAFVPNPDGKPVVDHIDTNPQNNHIDNLRWVTVPENCLNPITREHNSSSKMGHPPYGRELTEEERRKISVALSGRKFSDEHRTALSEGHKNSQLAREKSAQNLIKARKAQEGIPMSAETKEKIRDKMIGVHKGKKWKVVNGKRVWY